MAQRDQVIECPDCGHHWEVSEETDGEGLECPECGSEDVHSTEGE